MRALPRSSWRRLQVRNLNPTPHLPVHSLRSGKDGISRNSFSKISLFRRGPRNAKRSWQDGLNVGIALLRYLGEGIVAFGIVILHGLKEANDRRQFLIKFFSGA